MNLISTLLPLIIQYGPGLVKDVIGIFEANPQQQGETDQAYIDRLSPLTDTLLANAKAEDNQVIGDDNT